MKYTIFILVFTVILAFSCQKDNLYVEPQDRISEASVWTDNSLVAAYQAELYQAINHGFAVNFYGKFTDECVNTMRRRVGQQFILNTYNPGNIDETSGGGDWYYWDKGYTYIRKINVFLEQMEETTLPIEKDRLVAEAKFVRAYIYFKLLRTFGGVPILDEVFELQDEGVEINRNTMDECFAYIEQQLSEAIVDLPESYASTDSNFGRATGDACRAMRSRLRLYAASPLYNTNGDMRRWQDAADAAEELIGKYALHPDYQSYFELNQNDANNETIFSRGFTASNGHQFPGDHFNRRYGSFGGWWGSGGPSQNLVNDYDMINGEPPFLADGTLNPAAGYDPQDPYANRDPRFEASIVHDETVFQGDFFEMWVSEDGESWGFDNFRVSGDNPTSNYVIKKFMPSEIPINRQTVYTNQWPIYRYAEILLNYAEAKFELGDEATAREYINLVRARPSVDMPPIPDSVTGMDLRRRLYNERRIELVFEAHRVFDVRRWKIADVTENGLIKGMDIFLDTNTGAKRYQEKVLIDKTDTWADFKAFMPIDQDEATRIPGIQTTGY